MDNIKIIVNNPYKLTLKQNKIISCDSQIEKPLVNLSYYAKNNIPNYTTIKQLPQEHIDYLNITKGINMRGMFSGCNSFTSIDVSNWDTNKVKDMYGMFGSCESII